MEDKPYVSSLNLYIQEDIWIFKEALHFFDYAHAVYGWKHFVACHKQCTGICHILCATR